MMALRSRLSRVATVAQRRRLSQQGGCGLSTAGIVATTRVVATVATVGGNHGLYAQAFVAVTSVPHIVDDAATELVFNYSDPETMVGGGQDVADKGRLAAAEEAWACIATRRRLRQRRAMIGSIAYIVTSHYQTLT